MDEPRYSLAFIVGVDMFSRVSKCYDTQTSGFCSLAHMFVSLIESQHSLFAY